MKKYENIFKALFIVATVFCLMLFVGIFLAIGLTGAYGELSQDDRIALTVMGFIILFIIVVFTVIGILIYKDAKKLGMNAWMWTLIAIYAPNGVGIIIYLIFRYNEKQKKKCSNCNYTLTGAYKVCPQCGESLGTNCPECDKPAEPEWKVCPYCRHVLKD